MSYILLSEIQAQKVAHITHELWSGRAGKHWIKTLRTLRSHYLNNWDRGKARALIANNVRDAAYTLNEGDDLDVQGRATNELLHTVEAMFEMERT